MKRFDDLDLDKNGVLTGDELEGLLITLGRPLAGPELTIAFAIMENCDSGNWQLHVNAKDASV